MNFEYNTGRDGSFHTINACRYALVVGLIENRIMDIMRSEMDLNAPHPGYLR